MADKKRSSSENQAVWVPDEMGYQRTGSRAIIAQTLKKIKGNRKFVTLIQKGYQSVNTIIVDYDDNQLLFDKPLDWPDNNDKVIVAFRSDSGLLSHFTVSIKTITKDTLYTEYPKNLYQLQRREQYRVGVPRESRVSFFLNGKKHSGYSIENISASGMLLYRKNKQNLEPHHELTNIKIFLPEEFPPHNSEPIGDTALNIKRGEVVRVFDNQRSHLCYAGVRFLLDATEEELIFKYVRQRELELLRKI